MFEGTIESIAGNRPGDELDAALERLLTAGVDETAPSVPDRVPQPADRADEIGGVDDNASPATYGTCAPSGWLALALDSGTADPADLADPDLIEAIIGFDRLASWAAARQARLLAELVRRRPADQAPQSARHACLGSEYAPDEVGVALHLARGTAAARLGLAHRLLTVLPATHTLWES